jgi:small-conductance mechanosensitive channel/CRP-like cAMP-binding protein
VCDATKIAQRSKKRISFAARLCKYSGNSRMDVLSHWFASGGGSTIAAVTIFVALLVTIALPQRLKSRPRAVLGMALIGVLAELPQVLHVWEPAWKMLRAASWVLIGCAAARLLVVLVIDLAIERTQRRPVQELRRDVVQTVLYVVAVAVALRAADVSVTGMVATGTVLTAIIGLALQETLGNLAAGVALQFERTIDLGDWLRVDKSDLQGRVVGMSWRSVVIETEDCSQLVVPNGVFTKTPFVNYSRPGGIARGHVHVTVSADVPPVHVQEALREACRDCVEVLTDPAPSVITVDFNERGVTYWLRFFVENYAHRSAVTSEVTTKVWYELRRRKIDLGVPRRVTFMHKLDEQHDARMREQTLRDRRAAIDSVDFLREVSEQGRDTLAQEGRRLLFAPNEFILEEGHKGRTFYIVRSGEVAVYENNEELTRLGPGTFFGEMALLTGEARNATVMSVTEAEVFEIGEAAFARVIKAEPRVVERIGTIVGERQAQFAARRQGVSRPSIADMEGRSGEVLAAIKNMFGLG